MTDFSKNIGKSKGVRKKMKESQEAINELKRWFFWR